MNNIHSIYIQNKIDIDHERQNHCRLNMLQNYEMSVFVEDINGKIKRSTADVMAL